MIHKSINQLIDGSDEFSPEITNTITWIERTPKTIEPMAFMPQFFDNSLA